jgi:RimJ/RimL family protein N-acetyltransferase
VEGFKRFIQWTHLQRRAGLHACFGIVPPGDASAIGLLQIWPIELDFSTAEWGFVLSEAYWGTGLFASGARLLLDFAFGTLGVLRLEARAAEANARGNGVLRKLGATREGVLRRAFRDGDELRDHVMWSILADEWFLRRESGVRATEEDGTA